MKGIYLNLDTMNQGGLTYGMYAESLLTHGRNTDEKKEREAIELISFKRKAQQLGYIQQDKRTKFNGEPEVLNALNSSSSSNNGGNKNNNKNSNNNIKTKSSKQVKHPDLKCNKCGKIGHTSDMCWSGDVCEVCGNKGTCPPFVCNRKKGSSEKVNVVNASESKDDDTNLGLSGAFEQYHKKPSKQKGAK